MSGYSPVGLPGIQGPQGTQGDVSGAQLAAAVDAETVNRNNADVTFRDTEIARSDAEIAAEIAAQHASDLALYNGSYEAIAPPPSAIIPDTAVLQPLINALPPSGVLVLQTGTYRMNVTVPSDVRIRGGGKLATECKSVAGSNADVIKGSMFASVAGSAGHARPSTPETQGDNSLHLSDLCIDGNKANNAAGYGIRVWGMGHVWHNVLVRNCKEDGIWTEFSQEVDSYSGDTAIIAAEWTGITTKNNDGNGWTHLGPQSSRLTNFDTFGNGGYGFESRGSGALYDGVIAGGEWNSYLNGAGSYKFGSNFNLGSIIASAASVGTGVEMASGLSDCSIGLLHTGGHPIGLVLRGSGHHINAIFATCSTSAVKIDTAASCVLHLTVDNLGASGKVFDVVSDQGSHFIAGSVHLTGAQTLDGGTALTGNSNVFIHDIGGIGSCARFASRVLTAGGYHPILPQSDGNILADDAAASVNYKSMGATNTYRGLTVEGDVKATVSGSRGSNAALASLLTALAGYGLITDSST